MAEQIRQAAIAGQPAGTSNSSEIASAWALIEVGEGAADPAGQATQDRLRACVYTIQTLSCTRKLLPLTVLR